MSFFTGIKTKDKARKKDQSKAGGGAGGGGGGGGKKSQFYVEFLGWMESAGVRGRRYTEPAVQALLARQSARTASRPPKLTIQLTPEMLNITQEVEERLKPRPVIKKIKFPAIPARDVTFAVQSRRAPRSSYRRSSSSSSAASSSSPTDSTTPEDIVACIYLGYMPRTRRYVHVHVYRFDEPSTAATFAQLMNELIKANAHRVDEVERELVRQGQIEDPSRPPGRSSYETSWEWEEDGEEGGPWRAGTGRDSAAGSVVSEGGYSEDGYPLGFEGHEAEEEQEVEEDLRSLCEVQPFDSVAEELKYRLSVSQEGPLLLPPKDYDTISRARGNMADINVRRHLSQTIPGERPPGQTPLPQDTLPSGTQGTSEQQQQQQQQRRRVASDESGIDLASPSSDGQGDVLGRFPPGGGSDPPSEVPSPRGGFGPDLYGVDTYPYSSPRQDLQGGAEGGGPGGGYSYYSPRGSSSTGPFRRHSMASSAFSSRGSQHSSDSGGPGPGAGEDRAPPPFQRRHSATVFNGFPARPTGGGSGSGSGSGLGSGSALPSASPLPFSEELLPPRDYDHDQPSPREGVHPRHALKTPGTDMPYPPPSFSSRRYSAGASWW